MIYNIHSQVVYIIIIFLTTKYQSNIPFLGTFDDTQCLFPPPCFVALAESGSCFAMFNDVPAISRMLWSKSNAISTSKYDAIFRVRNRFKLLIIKILCSFSFILLFKLRNHSYILINYDAEFIIVPRRSTNIKTQLFISELISSLYQLFNNDDLMIILLRPLTSRIEWE